jgi:hypothetical protein
VAIEETRTSTISKSHGGVERLLDSMPVRLKASEEGDIVGVVIDADIDVAARWRSLSDRLIRVGYTGVPTARHRGHHPRPAIWHLTSSRRHLDYADNQTKGILEDFLRFLLPARSPLFDHIATSVATIPAGERRFSQLLSQRC